MGYTKMDIEEYGYVINCNDCGAQVVNGKEEDIKHYATCKPTDMTQFNQEEE